MTTLQRKRLAVMAGSISGLHEVAKNLEAEGVEGLDPIACALEDIFGILNGLIHDLPDPEALAEVL